MITGNELKEVRKSIGLTQEQLAAKWGITRVTVIKYESCGDQNLPNAEIMRVCVNQLITEQINPEKLKIVEKAMEFIASEREIYGSNLVGLEVDQEFLNELDALIVNLDFVADTFRSHEHE